MTDVTSNSPKTRARNRRSVEFTIFFSLILVLAIPFAIAFWALDVIQKKSLMIHGPFARAWSEANRVTPLIFSL